MSDTEHTHSTDEADDPVWRALRGLPREDLPAAVLTSQRARLHAALARACPRSPQALRAQRFARGLESLLLCLCGACVLVRLALALLLFLRAGT